MSEQADNQTVTLVFSSDIHGRWSHDDDSSLPAGGLSSIAAYVRDLRSRHKHVVWIDAGDLLQGTPLTRYLAQADMDGATACAQVLAASGLDLVVPGNHDFDYGHEYLGSVIKQTPFPWLAANIERAKGGEKSEKWAPNTLAVMEATYDDMRVAFIGVTTRLPMWQHSRRMGELFIADEVDAVQREVDRLQRLVCPPHAIVVCYHGGLETADEAADSLRWAKAENQALRMLAEVDGIDVLMTGHQHQMICERRQGTLVLQPGAHGQAVGKVTLRFSNGESTASAHLVQMERVEDQELLHVLAHVRQQADRQLQKPLCLIDQTWSIRDYEDVVKSEHPLIAWMHEVQLAAADADLSAVAYTGAYQRIEPPALCHADIDRLFPYDDGLVVLQIDGERLCEALMISASWYAGQSLEPSERWKLPHLQLYQYTMFAGVTYILDLRLSGRARVREVYVRGEAVNQHAQYRIVMSKFLADQASLYPVFRKLPRCGEIDKPLHELLIEDASTRVSMQVSRTHSWHIVGLEGRRAQNGQH